MSSFLDEAIGLLKWAIDDFEKHGISNDNWYGDVQLFMWDMAQRKHFNHLPKEDREDKEEYEQWFNDTHELRLTPPEGYYLVQHYEGKTQVTRVEKKDEC